MTTTTAGAPPPDIPRFRGIAVALIILIVAAALGVTALWLIRRHATRRDAAARHEAVSAGPRVYVAPAPLRDATREVTLPGDVRAATQSTIYGKVSGYLKSIDVDKGDRVKNGQLLGVIASRETDQQVTAARADLVIKERTYKRYQELFARGLVA